LRSQVEVKQLANVLLKHEPLKQRVGCSTFSLCFDR
jgi:hypothetical protein